MRIRSIKPEFCSDEKIGQLSREERLHFILLWMVADKYGVLEYKPRQLAVQLYPYDDDMNMEHFDTLTSTLLLKDLCSAFQERQQDFLWVRNFAKHQKLTSWERKDSKPIFAATELRKLCGSTDVVLPSEERRGKKLSEQREVTSEDLEKCEGDDVHRFLVEHEPLSTMSYEADLGARRLAGVSITDPRLMDFAKKAADRAVVIQSIHSPGAFWQARIEEYCKNGGGSDDDPRNRKRTDEDRFSD